MGTRDDPFPKLKLRCRQGLKLHLFEKQKVRKRAAAAADDDGGGDDDFVGVWVAHGDHDGYYGDGGCCGGEKGSVENENGMNHYDEGGG